MKIKNREIAFEDKVKILTPEELVATFQYVSGLFESQREKMKPAMKETAYDLNVLKHEILNRIDKRYGVHVRTINKEGGIS